MRDSVVSTVGPVRQANLGAQIAQLLREMILRRELEHGERLVEETLATRFDVSRGPIRDAFRQLEGEGLLQTRRRGIYVVGLTTDDIVDLYDLREALELLAVRRVMTRATEEQMAGGVTLVETMRAAAHADDHRAFADADIEFHSLIFSISGNPRLATVWRQYEPILSTILHSAVEIDSHLTDSAEDHHKLWELIQRRDDTAIDEAGAHIHRARDRMIAAYQKIVDLKKK